MLCRSAYHRHCWASQEGTLDIVDVGAAERIEAVPAHTGPVWSLAALPDSSGAQPALRFVPAAPAPCSGPTTEDFAGSGTVGLLYEWACSSAAVTGASASRTLQHLAAKPASHLQVLITARSASDEARRLQGLSAGRRTTS